jgi:uncharacterized protein YwqG
MQAMDEERTTMRDMLSQVGLERIPEQLIALAKPTISLASAPVEDATQVAGATKLGGLPDLPGGVSWPRGRSLPLAFLAQLRLEDIAPYDSEHILPPEGLLLFFTDPSFTTYGDQKSDHGNWRIIYVEAHATLRRGVIPGDLPETARLSSSTLTYKQTLTLPYDPTIDNPDLTFEEGERDRYDAALALMKTVPCHQLLGHATILQDDPRPLCQRASGKEEVTPEDWLLLAQFDSDENIHFHLPDAGLLSFWIPRQSLINREFSATWQILQTT